MVAIREWVALVDRTLPFLPNTTIQPIAVTKNHTAVSTDLTVLLTTTSVVVILSDVVASVSARGNILFDGG